MLSEKFGEEWKRNYEYLEEQRKKALEYLGDKWILNGGAYTTKLKVLSNENKNPQS